MTAGLENTNLFKPITIGKNKINQRIVFAPTTRLRAADDHTPSDLMLQHYSDRAQTPGSLLISEATLISLRAGLYPNIPGIWNDKHVQGWKKITDAVHARGSYMACQLWSAGRVGSPELLKKHGLDLISPSALYESEDSKKAAETAGNPVRALTEEEIKGIIYEDYKNAAINAMEAGFDYVEIHSAHGYMLDQFLQPATNQRTDNYGGSIEKRARIVLEIIDLLSDTIGAEKLAIRLSPWAKFQGMKAEEDTVHPITTFSYVVNELQKRTNNGKQLAYLSIVEPRVNNNIDVNFSDIVGSNDFIKQLWKGAILQTGNYTYDSPEFKGLKADVDGDDRTMIAFSRYFTSNPDLIERLRKGLKLTPYVRPLFYVAHNYGYNTFPSYGKELQFDPETEKERRPVSLI
ncbi:NADH:flavin oxidoreductase/NADH oxidase [Schizosaccharomyces cryophilus OY26]|uniref:NADH:flavin oxidoreductase/NADH oxidase n=1 Tax=Schizosaccharomyces cryophilus (strain OY26 / ATCC MYA-4695 / CBS 11777 / NBRC 106824 / NRRL Y48691) TaxID=653667 RepID=S9W3E7_SCHCR|nr:NADH:flavin oxidoreductase/NADH oxidase [Schizosaccharomyces cryophilus OY26]EPY53074.1 NADH:flavin oxidoreductase/NADH oxidase [Schizosaccharomyces cryophilus OY26]